MMFDSFWWLMMMITVNSLSIKNGGVMMGMRNGVYNGGYTGTYPAWGCSSGLLNGYSHGNNSRNPSVGIWGQQWANYGYTSLMHGTAPPSSSFLIVHV